MATNASVLNEKLSVSTGDWLRVAVSTNIAAGNNIQANTLQEYDNGRDNAFQDHFVYIENFLNAGIERKVRNYYTANATLNVFGGALTADSSNTQTIRLSRIPYGQKQRAINTAISELYPTVHKWAVDKSLATNMNLFEYPLPSAFIPHGDVFSVAVNTVLANAATEWKQTYIYDKGFSITNEGNTLRLSSLHTNNYEIKIEGITPLETVVNPSDTVNIDEPQTSLLIAYAKYKLYMNQLEPVASQDVGRYESASARAFAEYKRLLKTARMSMPARPLRLGGRYGQEL